MDDYLEFRATTERMAARLAAQRANAVDRERLTACMGRIDRTHEGGVQHRAIDESVMAGPVEAAGCRFPCAG